MKADLLRNLTQSFAGNRALVSKAIRELYEADSPAFLTGAASVLRESEDIPGTRFILALLSTRPDFLRFLCDPLLFTPAQSAVLIRQLQAQDARAEWKLANLVAHVNYADSKATAFATHGLEVLGLVCEDASTLPALRELLHCPNARIRSKAALLIGHISRNPQWAKLTDVNRDARVAANAVESIWGLDTPVAKEVFRDALVSGLHRNAVNGAVGLYLARDPDAIMWLHSFARHEHSDFRAAAAWGMGRTLDPRFVRALDALSSDPEESVRRAAAHASGVLVEGLAKLKSLPEIPLQVTAEFRDNEHRVRVSLGEHTKLRLLDALHFSICNGTTPVEEYTFAEPAAGQTYGISFLGPRVFSRMVNVDLFTPEGWGEGAALETGDEEVKPLAEILRKLR